MGISDLLFPRRCVFCDEVLKPNEYDRGAHEFCYDRVIKVRQPFCYKCGKPLDDEEKEYCLDCRKYKKTFVMNRAAFVYGGMVKDSMVRLKYKDHQENAAFYGRELVNMYGEDILDTGIDGLVPVPVHKNRLRSRGYNQAYLIAKEMGARLSIPVYKDYLLRTEETVAMKQLNNLERIKNLEKAFTINENVVKLRKVLIVDDIYTTGATIEACSRVLKSRFGEDTSIYSLTATIGYGM